MSDSEGASSAPVTPSVRDADARRRRRAWTVGVSLLLLVILYALYGGFFGGASEMREVTGEFARLRYPGVFGAAQVQRVSPGYERLQIAGFGDQPLRGPRRAVEAALKLTRAGGLLFEVRGVASDRERDYLLAQRPYDCPTRPEAERLDEVAGVEIRRLRRSLLFRWLPTSVALCGTRVEDGVLTHVSGFATAGTYRRERAQLRQMLESFHVDRTRVPTAPRGCRLNVARQPPLYAQFVGEEEARTGRVADGTIRWIELPYQGDESVGRFTPAQLEEVARGCAEEQARFAAIVESGAPRSSPAAQDAQHAFEARCRPLYPTLRFLGAGELTPDALPRPLSGWTMQLGDDWVPALCP